MTQELVDAFEAGQVSLLREAEQPLLELENPYDWSQRLESGVDYAWDHLLYEGKYYSYYGIAPVVTLFLPLSSDNRPLFPVRLGGMALRSGWNTFSLKILSCVYFKIFPENKVFVGACGTIHAPACYGRMVLLQQSEFL